MLPSGKLVLSVGGDGLYRVQRRWADRKRWSAQGRPGDVLATIELLARERNNSAEPRTLGRASPAIEPHRGPEQRPKKDRHPTTSDDPDGQARSGQAQTRQNLATLSGSRRQPKTRVSDLLISGCGRDSAVWLMRKSPLGHTGSPSSSARAAARCAWDPPVTSKEDASVV